MSGQADPGSESGAGGIAQRVLPALGRALAALRRLGRRGLATLRRIWRLVRFAALRVWARIKPVVTVVSGIGWIVLIGAVASLVAGFALGWQELVFLGCTLAAGLLVAFGFIFGRAAFRVSIELSPLRVTAGDRALGRFLVTNTGSRRSIPSRFELPVGQGVAEFVVPPLDTEAEHEELFAVPTHRRAVIVAGPAVSVRGDQLGLFRRTVSWSDPVELFVHPVITRLEPSAAGLVRDLEGEVSKTVTNDDISFHALRAYEPGDALRSVHWRTSARTGQLMVRQFEETRRSQLAVLFTSDRTNYADEAEFELAVSVLASIGVRIISDGTAADFLTEKLALRGYTRTTLLDDSCRIEQHAPVHSSLREFAREATKRLPPPSVAMVIGGSRMSQSEIRSVEAFFGPDTLTVGFRVERDAVPRLGVAGRLRTAHLGRLSDLPRLLRRAM